ncbi:MAG: flagellar basal body P-ring protein FlgI [Planctomycetes bacterium]|nr:flagellar basal body P-ring protein FlgI [Planctomycetota bacterium]MCC7171046.1 flagellar basal body P-ring protein FlgI [Planctomycetota bacterium]
MFAPLLLAVLLQAPTTAAAPRPGDVLVRIGDLADVKGVRENALIGTGIIVGLNGTGDSTPATRQALANLLAKQNLNLKPGDLTAGNSALVIVTATLPPFSREGDRLDVTVSATGGAKSLFGGTLLFSELSAADGKVWAVAQGPVTIGGFSAEGKGASVAQNHPTVGFLTAGATVEDDLDTRFLAEDNSFSFRLRKPDFATASRMVDVLNKHRERIATPIDPATVRVRVPADLKADEVIAFVAEVSELQLTPYSRARVVVNEKTGTIIAGEWVRIRSVAIAHGNLTVTVAESPIVSQPQPFSNGETTTVDRTDVSATVDSGNGVTVLPTTTSIAELSAALNALGATPRDLITILQMLKQADALEADLEVL